MPGEMTTRPSGSAASTARCIVGWSCGTRTVSPRSDGGISLPDPMSPAESDNRAPDAPTAASALEACTDTDAIVRRKRAGGSRDAAGCRTLREVTPAPVRPRAGVHASSCGRYRVPMPPERLTALDASFLYLERPWMHMHVSATTILDPSTREDGRLRFEDVERVMASRVHLVPRFRQRIAHVPFDLGLPLWIDDVSFDLGFHVRRAALPAPGGRRELADFVQRVLSRPLDRTKPLWELYVIEGLEDGHVATLMKVHHAMIDGLSGMHVAAAVYDLSPTPLPMPAPPAWVPDAEPTPRELVAGALQELMTHP